MVHVVNVGENGTLTFSPDDLQVNAGDMVQFQFYPQNHSVVQSAFNSPCEPINSVMSNVTGFKSGYMPVSESTTRVPVFTMMVNDTKPIWIYCSQKGHCQKGMVMAINAPSTGNKTFAAFKALAMGQSSSSTPGSVYTSSSPTGTGGASAPSITTTLSTSTAGRPVTNVALLMVLFIACFAFVRL